MATIIGIIAEDDSDVAVTIILARKIAQRQLAFKKFVGHGCGPIAGKCRRWAESLRLQGCSELIVLHDLDTRVESELRHRIANQLLPSPIGKYVIVIPVRELEAWILSDMSAVRRALRIRKEMKVVPNPEAVNNPKERLGDLIYSRSEKRVTYINTIHNPKIAALLSVNVVKTRCNSFAPFVAFFSRA